MYSPGLFQASSCE